MGTEFRMSSAGQLSANDTDDFLLGGYDNDTGVQQYVAQRLVAATGHQVCAPSTLTAAGSSNLILPGVQQVSVIANVNGVTDWITLPALTSVPIGHTVVVVTNAAGHKVRTPAASTNKINNVNSDGTASYTVAAGVQVHRFTKVDNTVGWIGQGFTALGAVVTAIVPA
jgi:hypothetical protein